MASPRGIRVVTTPPEEYDPTLDDKKQKTSPQQETSKQQAPASNGSKPKRRRKPKPAEEIVNPIEVQPEGTIDETLDQRRLREFYQLKKQYTTIRDKYEARLHQLQDLIIRGATNPDPDGKYKLQSGVVVVRRLSYKTLLIDEKGEAFQQRALERAPRYAYFRVRVK